MIIYSWNVNGLRAIVKKNFADFLKKESPDVLCLQETKISHSAREKVEFDFPGYEEYLHAADRPGYSGTATLIKTVGAPLAGAQRLRQGDIGQGAKGQGQALPLRGLLWDNEGRVQTVEFEKFYLLNVYFPNANHELSRLNFKLDFNDKILDYAKKLEKKKPVVICGDYNVAHEEIDLARPKDNIGNPGFTYEERLWMTRFLQAGFVDTFRYFNSSKAQYSWWSYRFGARMRNIGWRIDYFCVSKKLIKHVKNALILDKITGSDHCPVMIELDLK
jgi:exodeoxyribonuclease III